MIRSRPHAVDTDRSSVGTRRWSRAAATEERRHPRVALEAGDLGRVVARHPAADQPLDRRLAGGRLAQRREHLGDVLQEERVGADDEHALAVELLPVLEEQEGGPVEADGRLARARAALHDEARVERRADHDVLLGRDGRDDVAHLAGARSLELGEQRIGDPAVVGGVDAVGVVEHLVEEVVDVATPS